MIFVTVGTHEQQFNRLVEYVDKLKGNNVIDEEVVIQTGFSTYEPQYCEWRKFLPYDEMLRYVNEARTVITHGGPSSFIMPLQVGKIPIVVPRQKQFGEHVNNHQVDFAKQVEQRQDNIIVVENMVELENILSDYEQIVAQKHCGIGGNNISFCREIEKLVDQMLN